MINIIPIRAQKHFKAVEINLFEKDVTLIANGTQSRFKLPDSFIVAGTDSVWFDSVYQIRDQDYRISYEHNTIEFDPIPQQGAKIRIKYDRFPLKLKRRFFHRQKHSIKALADSTDSTSEKFPVSPAIFPASQRPTAAADLRKSGSIVRGISIGTNQGLKLDSGLRMQVSGKVANKVDIIAALTDQNTPIQPEGNTQSLQEIDKVFVQIKSKRFQATLGDYYLNFDETEFGRYNRKLQGAMGTARFDRFEVTLSGAVSRGKYTTNQIVAQEGNQGPYQLKGETQRTDIIVLAGTEKVWIDGELMTRGENNDYIIEYSNGQITFTRHRLITADSRITVDFQYSDQKFRRNLYSASTKASLWSDKIALRTTLLREADDKDNPLDFTLSEDNYQQLRQAGDLMDSAYVNSARSLGEGKGNYIQRDSLGIQFYQYVGLNKGDYSVGFSYVGYGKGDYRVEEVGKYKYVGPGNGSYIPKILLTPAQSHDLLDFDLNISPSANVTLNSEFALSRMDLNTYSSKDDGDNQGFAYKLNLGMKPQKIKYLGKFELNGKYRYVNPRFQQIDRTTEVEYNRRWDLDLAAVNQEQVQEIRTGYHPWEALAIKSGFGRIDKGNHFYSRRWDIQTKLDAQELPRIDHRLEMIKSDNKNTKRSGAWQRQKARAFYRFWKLQPELLYEGEIKKDVLSDTFKTGFRFDEFGGGLSFSPLAKLTASALAKRRIDDDWGNFGFKRESIATTQHYRCSLNNLGPFSASMEYTHRDKAYAEAGESNKRTDLAELKTSYAPFQGALSSQLYYQISNTQTSKRERIPQKVEEGEGNYRYDPELKEYIPDPMGDYVLLVMNTDIFIPVVELKASTTLRLEPARFFKSKGMRARKEMNFWKKLLLNLSSETMLRLEEKTQERDVWSIYRLELSKFRNYETTEYGTNFLRQDIHFMQNNRRLSIRLRLQRQDEMNNQYLEGGQSHYRLERSLRLTGQLSSKFSSQINILNKRNRRIFRFPGRRDRDVFSGEGTFDLAYRPKSVLEFALKTRAARDVDQIPEVPVVAYLISLIPRLNYSFRGKGRLMAQVDWSRVGTSSDDPNVILPYEMVGGNRIGQSWRWNISFNYQISRNIQASLSYTGRNEPHLPDVIHLGRAEMQAFF